MACRVTGWLGRKGPSRKPFTMPASAAHEISSKKALVDFTSLKPGFGNDPLGEARYRNMKAAIAWRAGRTA